jgi:hypothetical protein
VSHGLVDSDSDSEATAWAHLTARRWGTGGKLVHQTCRHTVVQHATNN